jgi:phospholipase C
VSLIKPPGVETDSMRPCFEHKTLADILPRAVSWRYYTPMMGSIWTAPNAIQHICLAAGGKCTGPEYTSNVDDVDPADVLRDIANCNLRSLSWVIPTGYNSDHAHDNDGGGPSWVAAIVNAIGESSACDGNTGYWKNTAIIITWDDWGGWYDHVAPTMLGGVQGDYQYGFRVPMIVVSAYTPKGYIDNTRHDFGSITRFVQQNFDVTEGKLGFSDVRAKSDLTEFFDPTMAARPYQHVAAKRPTAFFLNERRKATPPDIDDDPGAADVYARGRAGRGRGPRKRPMR